MNRTAPLRPWVVALCLAAPLLADEARPATSVADLVKRMKGAVKAGDLAAAKAAFKSAEAYKPHAKSAMRLAAALGSCIKASHKKQSGVAIAAMESLGRLEAPGAVRQILFLLKAPRKVAYERIGLHLVAIRVAGRLHDASSLRPLENLLGHHSTDLVIAASAALAEYRLLEDQPRIKLVERLVRVLNGFEKKRATVKTYDRRNHYDKASGHLVNCLANLTDNPVATTASDWATWLKSEKKRQRDLNTGRK